MAPETVCRAGVRGVLGYSVCVCVCVSGAQFLNGKTEVLKPDGGTQTSSRDGPKLLMSELVNQAEPSSAAP